MTDDFKLIPFPRDAKLLGVPPGTLETIAAVTELLRSADRLSKAASRSELDESKWLQIVQTVREIVVSGSSLYLLFVDESEHSKEARVKIEAVIDDLKRL